MKNKTLSLFLVLIASPLVAFAYNQTDRKIEDAAKASYNFRTVLEEHVTVKSDEGVVTLTGTVADAEDKALAEDTVANLPGVLSVKNEIEVEAKYPEHSDNWMALKIRSRLLVRAHVSVANTQVAVTEGHVVLTGTAKNSAQKELTEAYAKDITGVKSVQNDLVVKDAAPVAPTITNSTLTAAGTVGTAFSYTITASGLATSYSASPLPAGLSINTSTGVISGTPTAAETAYVVVSAMNATGNDQTTLTMTFALAGVVPIITNRPLTAACTVGTAFSYTITATGSPTSYSARPLPAGLVWDASTGVISGTPTTAGTTYVVLGAANGHGTCDATLTITVALAGVDPIITNSPLTAAGTVGTAFSYTITATGSPTSYSASPLPVGLVRNATTGVISGIPTAAGTTYVVIGAANGHGTCDATLAITVAAAGVRPTITNNPLSAACTVGTPFSYTITATGSPASYSASPLPAGLVRNATTGVISGTPTAAGTTYVVLGAANGYGTCDATLKMTIGAAASAPIFNCPATAIGTAGTPFVTYPIIATGLPTSFGATGLPTGLRLNTLSGTIDGTPTTPGTYVVTLTATNATGTSTSDVTITVGYGPNSRIVNFSARALSGPGEQTLIMGFIVSGNNKNLLVRGIGPSLSLFGITNPLADPLVTLYDTTTAIASNDNWSHDSMGRDQSNGITAMARQVGAFALPVGSMDSCLLYTANNGAHTTGLFRQNSTTGVALTEIYDTDTTPAARLINVSARMNVTTGEGTLIAGFIIAGDVPKTVLIRGIGPTLTQFAVTGVLADPQISVYANSTLIDSNDNWGTGTSSTAEVIAASVQVGAFSLPIGSKDAALLLTLQPGAYTVVVTGVANTTGIALVEVYDVL